MEVTIKYHDTESLTVEEIVKQAVNNYGNMSEVEIRPDSTMAYDHIYFGLQQLLTKEQISIMYEKNGNYQTTLSQLRASVLSKVTEIIDQVIVDNESKVA